jgi:hypothetical protein
LGFIFYIFLAFSFSFLKPGFLKSLLVQKAVCLAATFSKTRSCDEGESSGARSISSLGRRRRCSSVAQLGGRHGGSTCRLELHQGEGGSGQRRLEGSAAIGERPSRAERRGPMNNVWALQRWLNQLEATQDELLSFQYMFLVLVIFLTLQIGLFVSALSF